MGEPQTLREAAQAVVKAWEGDAQPLAVTLENVEIAMRALRAALASSDSLRLDPEDPDSVERLRALSEAATPGPWAVGFADGSGSTYVAGPNEQPVVRGGSDSYGIPQGAWRPGDATLIVAAVNYVRSRLAHEWKASALPDRRSGLDRRHGPGADLPNVHERRSTHRRKGDWEAHIARASALPDPAPEAQA